MIRLRSVSVALALCVPFALASCSSGEDDHGHDHGEDGHSHAEGDDQDHGDDEDHMHAGEPTVLFEGAAEGLESLTITWLRTEEIGDEILVIVDAVGGSPTIRGRVVAGDGSESLTIKGEAENDTEHHLHMNELPASLDLATAKVVVEVELEGADAQSFELPFVD